MSSTESSLGDNITQFNDPAQEDFVASFAQQRQRLLFQAGALLTDLTGDAGTQGLEADLARTTELSRMLVAALGVLKVAEDELREERQRTATENAIRQRQLDHLQAMFDLAPTPLILTTTDSSIRACNRAAAVLFGRDAYELDGHELSSMVPREQSADFKRQLALALEMQHVAAWSFTLKLQRSAPVAVSASVSLIDDAGVDARALYWNIRPLV